MRTATDQGIRVQRGLLDAGACEASAIQACGRRAAGVSVLLGNYHNTTDEHEVAPEWVALEDVKSTVALLKALVATRDAGKIVRPMEERVAVRMRDYADFIKAAKKHF